MRHIMYSKLVRYSARLLVAFALAFYIGSPVSADHPADKLTLDIETRVFHAKHDIRQAGKEASVVQFSRLAVAASWTEVWSRPGKREHRTIHARLWNQPIRAALERYDAVFLPKRDRPYYINEPIVLKSGQRLRADRDTEIRLVPGTNPCMVRNERLTSGQNGPIPPNVEPDTGIMIEGGIWTTLATSPTESNGNVRGRAAKRSGVAACHGVIILSNLRGVVVRNVIVRQSRAHAVQLSNCCEFLVEGVAFDDHRRDGIHVNGPASYGVIRNIQGVTGDDCIALNAWDWCNTAPSFGPIGKVVVERIHGDPRRGGTDEIRLLPGTKTFSDGTKLDCPVHDCVFRDLHDIRTFKIYDQPNLELGRDKDFSDPIGTVKNIYFENLTFNRPGRFQIAVNVDGLSINDVRLKFPIIKFQKEDYTLVEIGPMSQTYRFNSKEPSRWVELFSPDRDVTIRGFHLANVHVNIGNEVESLNRAEDRLVKISDQKLNPNYPKTTPRGGTGKVILVR